MSSCRVRRPVRIRAARGPSSFSTSTVTSRCLLPTAASCPFPAQFKPCRCPYPSSRSAPKKALSAADEAYVTPRLDFARAAPITIRPTATPLRESAEIAATPHRRFSSAPALCPALVTDNARAVRRTDATATRAGRVPTVRIACAPPMWHGSLTQRQTTWRMCRSKLSAVTRATAIAPRARACAMLATRVRRATALLAQAPRGPATFTDSA